MVGVVNSYEGERSGRDSLNISITASGRSRNGPISMGIKNCNSRPVSLFSMEHCLMGLSTYIVLDY